MVKLAISNIAWVPQENKRYYELLQEHQFLGLEVAPSLVWDEPIRPSRGKTAGVSPGDKRFWIERYRFSGPLL